jgi:hypothetical protein
MPITDTRSCCDVPANKWSVKASTWQAVTFMLSPNYERQAARLELLVPATSEIFDRISPYLFSSKTGVHDLSGLKSSIFLNFSRDAGPTSFW